MSVLLLDAGPGRPFPDGLTTVEGLPALGLDDRFWPDSQVSASGDRPVHRYRLGRGLGGGAAVNSMVMMTGSRHDYDAWERDHGAGGWDWAAMEPWFDLVREDITIATAEAGPLATAMREAARAHGHDDGPPSVEPDGQGFCAASLAASGLYRVSPVDALLPYRSVETIRVRTEQSVRLIAFRGRAAIGVGLSDGRFLGSETVVLCAGALGSPAILARSGMGSPPHRLIDHPSFVFSVALRPDHRVGVDRPTPPISSLLRWRLDVDGPDDLPIDIVAQIMDHVGDSAAERCYGAVVVALLTVRSVGHFETDGAGYDIEPGWLAHPDDRDRLMTAVRHVAELLSSPALGDAVEGVYLDDRGTPASVLCGWSDDELAAWLRAHPGPVHHPAASLPLGGRQAGMKGGSAPRIDLDGAVVGCEQLYVADGSILPWLPAANPQLPIMAVAARIADGIVQR